MNKKELPAETAAEKTTKADVTTSRHTIGKPHVACSFLSTATKNNYENVEQNLSSVICQLKAAYDSSGRTSSTISMSLENTKRN